MPKLDDTMILTRARELCERDGLLWEEDHARVARSRRVLDGSGRRDYLTRAREQLMGESENSA